VRFKLRAEEFFEAAVPVRPAQLFGCRKGVLLVGGSSRALEVPMYQLFYDGEEPPKLPNLPKRKTADDIVWGSKGKDARLLAKFCRLFSRMEEGDRGMVLFMAQKMAHR
jgi:hypothetical protein